MGKKNLLFALDTMHSDMSRNRSRYAIYSASLEREYCESSDYLFRPTFDFLPEMLICFNNMLIPFIPFQIPTYNPS